MAIELIVDNLDCGYDGEKIIDRISFRLETGQVMCLLGPNGVGKTTLLKAILGFIKPTGGAIRLNGESIGELSDKRRAQVVGYVPQAHTPPFPFRVFDVVLMGRTARMGTFSSPSKSDKRAVKSVLRDLGIGYLANKIYTEVSGGERQLVLVARTLVQEPQLLIMDEPTSNLDYGNQVRVLREVRDLSEKGLGVLMTSHSPDQAFLCATRAGLMLKGGEFIDGAVEDVVTEPNLRRAYGIDVRIGDIRGSGEPVRACVPLL